MECVTLIKYVNAGRKDEVEEVNTNRSDTLNDVNYKPNESTDEKMSKHELVQSEDAKIQEQNWKETKLVSPTFEECRIQIRKIPEEFTGMWDSHLGTIKAVKHHIDLE